MVSIMWLLVMLVLITVAKRNRRIAIKQQPTRVNSSGIRRLSDAIIPIDLTKLKV
jgi:hypothetical protein